MKAVTANTEIGTRGERHITEHSQIQTAIMSALAQGEGWHISIR